MSQINLENQIKELNNKVSELALIVSLKTKEMNDIEKKYTENLTILNEYLSTIRTKLGIDEKEGNIEDTDLINKLQSLKFENGDENYVLIPTKSISLEQKSTSINKPKSADSKNLKMVCPPSLKPHAKGNNHSSGGKKKLSCSYCNEKGHKRAQCPKILYGDTI